MKGAAEKKSVARSAGQIMHDGDVGNLSDIVRGRIH